MDPKNQPQFNPKIPVSEVLKQEQSGFVPSAPKLSDVVNTIGNMYDSTKDLGASNTVQAATPTAPTAPATPATSPTTTPTASTNQTTPVRTTAPAATPPPPMRVLKTFRSDAVEATKTKQMSVAKIAIAESKQRIERGEGTQNEPKKKSRVGLLIAIILIVIGAISIPVVLYILKQKTLEVPINIEKTVIPFDHQDTLTLNNATRDDFTNALDEIQTKISAASGIGYIKVLEKIQDVDKNTITQSVEPYAFAGLIGPNMPSALARSFDSYMFGTDNSKSFVIFKTSSYQQTFANMLKWETKMIIDLNPALNLSTDVLGRTFTDQVIINKDVRAVTAPDGTIIFLYGFLDSQTLVITTSPQTLQDINSRYVAAHFVQ
jgi:hypothetical protein